MYSGQYNSAAVPVVQANSTSNRQQLHHDESAGWQIIKKMQLYGEQWTMFLSGCLWNRLNQTGLPNDLFSFWTNWPQCHLSITAVLHHLTTAETAALRCQSGDLHTMIRTPLARWGCYNYHVLSKHMFFVVFQHLTLLMKKIMLFPKKPHWTTAGWGGQGTLDCAVPRQVSEFG